MADRPKAIACWLNPTTGVSDYRPEFLVRVARDYFKREKEMFAHTPLEELLAQMDAAGVERAIITMDGHQPEPIHEIARSFPGKFICSAVIDPTTGMEALRLVDRLVEKYDLRLARVVPFLINRPPNDKAYYPLYAKCIELDLPRARSVPLGLGVAFRGAPRWGARRRTDPAGPVVATGRR